MSNMRRKPAPRILASPVPTIETITPDDAVVMLEANTMNRSLRQARVNRYAADMRAGAWQVSNDAVTVGRDGSLLNGQHRLWAVVESGVTVDMLVLRGVSPAARAVMDTGAARTAGDYFGKGGLGEPNSSLLAATIKQIILIQTNRIGADRSGQEVTNFAMEQWLDEHPEVRHSVATASRFVKRIEAPPRVLGVTHYFIAERNTPEIADMFYHQIATRAGEPEGSAVHAIDSRLRQVRRARATYEAKHFVAFFIRGWNAYAVGRSVRSLVLEQPEGALFKMPEIARASRLELVH